MDDNALSRSKSAAPLALLGRSSDEMRFPSNSVLGTLCEWPRSPSELTRRKSSNAKPMLELQNPPAGVQKSDVTDEGRCMIPCSSAIPFRTKLLVRGSRILYEETNSQIMVFKKSGDDYGAKMVKQSPPTACPVPVALSSYYLPQFPYRVSQTQDPCPIAATRPIPSLVTVAIFQYHGPLLA